MVCSHMMIYVIFTIVPLTPPFSWVPSAMQSTALGGYVGWCCPPSSYTYIPSEDMEKLIWSVQITLLCDVRDCIQPGQLLAMLIALKHIDLNRD